ncbi:helicase C-terminal domain-containing protein [Nocardioidaceae bacterium]|nr:helicase C-terminal domain-containing protein [Nocardioidaceae bacterium]
MTLDPWYEARRHMVEAVRLDLTGTSDEVLAEDPLERFVVGILHPRVADGSSEPIEVADDAADNDAGTQPDAAYDPAVSFAHLRYPSSMGLTVGLSEAARHLNVEVSADRYERSEAGRDWAVVAARRVVRVDLEDVPKEGWEVTDGLLLRVVSRRARQGTRSVTLVIVNTQPRPDKGRSDAQCWFRPRISVRATEGEFVDRGGRASVGGEKDLETNDLLYRRQRNVAVGHGVSVTWNDGTVIDEVSTTFFPEHDLQLADASRDDVPPLDMAALAAGDLGAAHALIAAYAKWIDELDDGLADLSSEQMTTLDRHKSDALIALERMKRGLALVEEGVAATAFSAMNSVMREQRRRQEMIRKNLDQAPEDVTAEWRPFQLAFVLMNLEGLLDPASDERDLADVLWFPTGGGKTEAYLGLISFSLVLRRLRAESVAAGAGVGVIMRYTLRLLTLQQFERAAGLICSLEDWRLQQDREMAPFSIGLWVGQGATPNNIKNAASALRKRQNDQHPGEDGDPVQLLRCPWCGHELTPHDYEADKLADELRVRCPRSTCRYFGREGLPVHLIDSDVYRERPSLVIGTVDKFAMLAWNEDSGRILGVGSSAPPDLIVQDELHLIAGPLGTLVGLYETGIDYLATDRGSGVRPKLVASTATIRRAREQVKAVFDRDARQFPPPGLDAGDSFFAVDASAEVKGTRKYVGLMAPSTSHATLLVRTYAALLQGAADLDASDEVKDAYWTLLGYFNSLRVLGAAYIQSIDDVVDRIKVVARRSGSTPRPISDPRELTSRKQASEIPEELAALETAMTDDDCPDVVLATNMISVGVDVDRLGLMVVMGQPQTTSEYIQATSRVGRQKPGLVMTLLNASRSRDLSHFEGFTSYHRSLYSQVEATSATPFAARALDRGLHGLLILLARHTVPGASDDKSVDVPVSGDELDDLVEVITARARRSEAKAASSVEAALEALIERWSEAVDDDGVDRYARWQFQSKDLLSLMVPAGTDVAGPEEESALVEQFPPQEAPWPTLTSLRNVDRESTLKIISTKQTKAVSSDGDE